VVGLRIADKKPDIDEILEANIELILEGEEDQSWFLLLTRTSEAIAGHIPLSVTGLAHIVLIDSYDDKEVISMAYHLDEKHSRSDFRKFKNAIRELHDADLAALYAGSEALALEGAFYKDACSDCVQQEQNGTRVLQAIDKEMKRRGSSN
jgi:hypothetical protein